MAHEQKPITALRDVNGIPYIGEEDDDGVQVASSLLYIKNAEGGFEPVGMLSPLPVSGAVTVGNLPAPMEYYGATVADRPDPAEVPVGALFMAVNTQEIWQSNGAEWVVV